MERGFLSQKEGGGGRGIKEKQQSSANVAEKDTVVVSLSVVDEPLDATVNTEEANVGQTPNSPTVNPKPESIRAISARFANTVYGFFLGKRVAYPVVANYVRNTWGKYRLGRSGYARVMIKVRADVELKDNIMATMPKITREGYYTCNIRVEYEWKPHRGVPVGPKVGFKPAKEYRPVAKKPTANTSGIKKKGVEPTKEGATSSGSSFWNVETSNISTTPIVEKIRKLEQLIIDGKGTLVDDDGKPLKMVDYLGDHDSDDEVCSVDNDMARSMAIEMVGFGTQSTLPIKYLGVPMVSRRLKDRNYKNLIEAIKKRVGDWRNKARGVSIRGMASVSWKDVCKPKSQRGLGLKLAHLWNEALMAKPIWDIVSRKNSMWVKWVNIYWLKVLEQANLCVKTRVVDIIDNNEWKWPIEWVNRHAFISWVAIKGRLKTLDRNSKWINIQGMVCHLCNQDTESHSHLFFKCEYSKRLWEMLKTMIKFDNMSNEWASVLSFTVNKPASNSIWSVIQRLTLGACVYFLWQERNIRCFVKKYRDIDCLFNIIIETVKMKLMGLNFKTTVNVIEAAKIWNLQLGGNLLVNKGDYYKRMDEDLGKGSDPMECQ
ncbi:hypothetical protein Tco_1249830 [Tanacetum coccineum]